MRNLFRPIFLIILAFITGFVGGSLFLDFRKKKLNK